MAAESSDLFKKVSRRWVGQIGAGGVADSVATTVPLSSTTNLPTDTAVAIVIDRVDASGTPTPTLEETVVGVVSGNNLVDCLRGVEGTAQAHSAGAVAEVLWTAANVNDLVDGILVEHNQAGGHTDITASQVSTDVIAERTSASGVTVDGLLIKDGGLTNWDGWMFANETWTYASATTITVPSGAASKYQKGDKIKLTQSASVKYFYIIGVADTVLTVTGGSDYTVADAAISTNFYSHQENPLGFPGVFNWTPVFTGFSSSPTGGVATFRLQGKMCTVIFGKWSNETSNATVFQITLPIAAEKNLDAIGQCTVYDATVAQAGPGHMATTAGSLTLSLYKSFYQTAWTNSGLKSSTFIFTYEID